jgi:biotin carboxyl carrier protein
MLTRQIFYCFICLLILFSCSEMNQEKKKAVANNAWTIDTVNIIHAVLPVAVPVKGYLEYWKKETILAEDTSQILTILVDDGQRVKDYEFLLSLWIVDKNKEYTPFDLRAPFAGIIEKVYVKVGSRVAKDKPLLHMYNDDYFSVRLSMHQDQMAFLRKNQKVIHTSDSLQLEGFIESLDMKSNSVRILLKNNGYTLSLSDMVTMDIICGNVRGDFVLSENFEKNKLMAYIDDESSFEILPVGVSDSLSLISPRLPHLSHIKCIKSQ